jgi:glycosyltransferase involved in cell wall biosynthesis
VRRELIGIGVSPERIQVILNGVDLEEFRPSFADRAAFGLPAGVPLALFVGDLRTPRKNLDTVLESLTRVPNLHLVVAGRTESSPYPALAARLNVDSRVHFLGFRRDVARLMQAADLFVFPSRYEACSLVLLEALASGLPIITARSAGGAEVVEADCGIVLDDPNNPAALAAALCRLSADSALRNAMGCAARTVAEQHSWTAMADRYLDLYAEMIR